LAKIHFIILYGLIMDFKDLLSDEARLRLGFTIENSEKLPDKKVNHETVELHALLRQYSTENELLKGELNRARFEKAKQPGFDWVDGKEAMKLLYISKRTLQNWRDNNTLGYSSLNGKYYYRRSEIDRLLKKNYTGSFTLNQ